MEAIIGPVQIEIGILVIGALIIIMAEFVMDGHEIVAVDLGTHFDAQIVFIVQIPSRRMAHDFAVERLDELGAVPEGRRQRLQPKRGIEALADLEHLLFPIAAPLLFRRIGAIHLIRPGFDKALRLEQVADIEAEVASACGRHHIIDIAPFLRPHIAEQVGADRACRGLHLRTICLVQLGAGVAMQFVIEGLHLRPNLVGQLGEIVGRHVIFRPPHRAGVGKAQFLRARIGDIDQLGIIAAHRRADIIMPAQPHFLEFLRIAAGTHFFFDVAAVDRLTVQRALAFAIGGLKPGREVVQLLGCARRRRGRQSECGAQQVEPPLGFHRQARCGRIFGRFERVIDRHGGADRTEIGGDGVTVVADIGGIDPGGPAGNERMVEHRLFHLGEEGVGLGLRGRGSLLRHGGRYQKSGRKRGDRDGDFHGSPLIGV